MFAPQQNSWPELRMPQVKSFPSPIAVQSTAVPIWTGDNRSVVVPSPSAPVVFLPQHHSELSLRIPHPRSPPDTICAQSVATPIWTGEFRSILLPPPPTPPRPHHHTALPLR